MTALYTAFGTKNENVSTKLTHSKFCFSTTTFSHAVKEVEQCLPVRVFGWCKELLRALSFVAVNFCRLLRRYCFEA